MATKQEIIAAIDAVFTDEDQIVWQAMSYDPQFKNLIDMTEEQWNKFAAMSVGSSWINDAITDAFIQIAEEFNHDNNN